MTTLTKPTEPAAPGGTGRGPRAFADFPKTQTWDGTSWLRADLAADRLDISLIRIRQLLRSGRIQGRRAPVWYAESSTVESYRRRRNALVKLLSA